MSKAAKRRAKERAKKQEALLAELRALDPGVAAVGDATPEQLAAATAATQRAAVAAKAEAAGATLDVELPLGAVRAEPTGGNPFPLVHKGFRRQTFPEPTVPVKQQFAAGRFLAGQLMGHPGDCNTHRITSAEKRALDRANDAQLQDLRQAAEVHRQVRRWAQSWIAPGIPLITIADRIEAKLEQLVVKNGLEAGQAFPTGVSCNHVAAHFTPNSGDTAAVLQPDDVLKIDFGVQINGRIIDSAWTWAQNPRYDPLLEAVRAATDEGIKQAGIDVRLGDVGAAIQEVMESHEIELNGKTHTVRCLRNLCGHNIAPYRIHGDKSVPIVKSHDATKMEEGELFAVETFGSTGRGYVVDDGECSHYSVDPSRRGAAASLRSAKAKQLLTHIDRNFATLAFCRKWLDRLGHDRHLLHLNQLCDAGIVEGHPPLCDVRGSYTAQFEHTFILRPTCKEVLSRGADY
jgi:methionyl aminopeptidase